MRFGMSTACFFPEVYLEDTIDVIGGMGIDTLEVFFSCLGEYRPVFVDSLVKRVKAQGVRVYSIHAFSLQFEPQLFTRHMRARHEAEGIYREALEAGAALGAEVYVFHGPVNLKRMRLDSLDYDSIAARAGELADTAAEYGIRLAWENVHYCWYERPDFAREMLRRANTDNLYFTLDVKQAAQAGYDPTDFLADTAGRLANVHLCDYAHYPDGVLPKLPFTGEMDCVRLRDALKESGYDAGMMLEVYRHNYESRAQLADNFSQVRSFFS